MLHVLWAIVTGLVETHLKNINVSPQEMREQMTQTMMLDSESPEMAAMYEQILDQFFAPLLPPPA